MQTNLFSQEQEIAPEEFRNFLSKPGWIETDSHAREIVYQFPLKNTPRVVVKVYSAIPKDPNNPPDRQQIKVFAIDLDKKKPLTTSIHIEKTLKWRKELQEVIMKTFRMAQMRR